MENSVGAVENISLNFTEVIGLDTFVHVSKDAFCLRGTIRGESLADFTKLQHEGKTSVPVCSKNRSAFKIAKENESQKIFREKMKNDFRLGL